RAASAVGVGLLLTAAPASARIVYTPAYSALPSDGATLPLDLNHDGITDFTFFSKCGFQLTCTAKLLSPAQAGNGGLGKIQGVLSNYGGPFTCRVASALPAGHRIGPGSKFGAYQTLKAAGISAPSAGPPFSLGCGYWQNLRGRFLGLEFMAQGQK